MNFVINSTDLLKNLQLVSGVVPSRHVLPIVENFLFEVSNGKLSITATDLDITMQVVMQVEARGEDVRVAVPSKLILDTLRNLPDQPITFIVQEENFSIELSTTNGKYKLSGENGEDFPSVPKAENTQTIMMKAAILVKVIQKTLFAASTDELKPAMNGMHFSFTPNGATFVTTDAHRLVRYRRLDVVVKEDATFIIPQKALNQLKNSLGGLEDVVSIEYNESNAYFSVGNLLMVCRLISDKFPDYENVIPTNNPHKLIVNKKELVSTLRRVNIFSNRTTHQIRFKITGNELKVSAEDIDYASAANEDLKCIYEGEDMELGYNAAFLQEVISNIDTEDALMELSSPSRASLVLPMEQEEGENLLMLVMPVMLSNY
jgi:DNA polymerase III subunit beta